MRSVARDPDADGWPAGAPIPGSGIDMGPGLDPSGGIRRSPSVGMDRSGGLAPSPVGPPGAIAASSPARPRTTTESRPGEDAARRITSDDLWWVPADFSGHMAPSADLDAAPGRRHEPLCTPVRQM